MSATQSIRSSIPDTELGLTAGEIQILRTQQQALLMHQQRGSLASERGRGTSRHSQPSSRAASAASSTGPGNRVILDPRHLQALHTHLDNIMREIEQRINRLEDATEESVRSSSDRHGHTSANADHQIERMKRIMQEIDHLEGQFARIKRIKEVVKKLKARVDTTGERYDRVSSSHSSHTQHHSSHHHHPAQAARERERYDRHR